MDRHNCFLVAVSGES